MQVFTMLVPLITLPYLIRVLGTETYGLVVFAQAVISYFVILVNFGFNISATKEVSIHRDNKEKLSEIVSSVLIIKGTLFFLSLLVLSAVLYFLPQAKGYEILFYLTMYMCLYEWLFPVWYFQGIEKMKYITLINLISRGIFLALVFIVVKEQSDYLLVPLVNGIGALIAGGVALWVVFGKEKMRYKGQPLKETLKYLKEGWIIFLGRFFVTVKDKTSIIVIGGVLTMQDVAYFDFATKINSVFMMPINMINQVIYPKVSREKDMFFVENIMWKVVFVLLPLVAGAYLLAPIIIEKVGGGHMIEATDILRIIILSIPIYIISIFTGQTCLFVFDKYKIHMRGMLFTSIFYLFLLGNLYFIDVSIIVLGMITVSTYLFEMSYRLYWVKRLNLMFKKR